MNHRSAVLLGAKWFGGDVDRQVRLAASGGYYLINTTRRSGSIQQKAPVSMGADRGSSAMLTSVRPATFTFRTEVISARARTVPRHRMTPAARSAPEAGAASFGDANDRAVRIANLVRHEAGTGGRRKAHRQSSGKNQ